MKTRFSLRTSFTFIALFFSVLAISCANRGAAAADSKATFSEVDDEARILGGLAPQSPALSSRLERTNFKEFSEATQTDWETRPNLRFTPSISAQDRLTRISEWSQVELKDFNSKCDTLFYPFGGPDLLNAQQFFPQCSHFVLVGLEQVGAFPPVAELLRKNQTPQFNAVLKGARASQAEIFSRGYIITHTTQKVQATSKLDGNGPLMAYLIERGGNTIQSITPFCIEDDLNIRAEKSAYSAPKCDFASELAGVTIEFKDAAGISKTATYIQSNLGNEAYQGLPGFTKTSLLARYLESTPAFQSRYSGRTFTMLKAASYCMHDTSFFGNIRNFITRYSAGILQDDSGIPFAWFAQDQWTFKFYGDYRRAVDDFHNFLQPKLAKVYYPQGLAGPRNPQIDKLPFNYGYNFWKASVMKIVPNSTAEPQVNGWDLAPKPFGRPAKSR